LRFIGILAYPKTYCINKVLFKINTCTKKKRERENENGTKKWHKVENKSYGKK